jgi:CRP-like cAMP-binding protein
MMKITVESLKKITFFKEFDTATIEKILKISELQEFDVEEKIFDEHQKLIDIFVLLEGKVILGINVPGKGKINLGTIHPGQLFSWSALFPPSISTAYAFADVPVKVLSIESSKIQELVGDNDTFGYKFMKIIGQTLSKRLSDTRFQLINMASV